MTPPHPTPLFLGCPVWASKDWIGTVHRPQLDQKDLLREYSKIFNTVEGNSFFYALPPRANLERWMAETADGFRFAPKFPKAITHEHRLKGAEQETADFLKALDILQHGDRLGTSFLQLPPSFNINNLDTLDDYLKALPKDFHYAVEARHISFFDDGPNEKLFDDLLQQRGVDKVIFDSRPLFSADADEPGEAEAMERKPHFPVRKTITSKSPFLRLICRNQLDKNAAFFKEWVPVLSKWILEQRQPYVLVHTADDRHAPHAARQLYLQLRKLNPLLPEFPAFPGELAAKKEQVNQLDLF